jgi:hypothetical protein
MRSAGLISRKGPGLNTYLERWFVMMVVWQSPEIAYWYAATGLRRLFLTPAERKQCFAALMQLAQRSDPVGERAREAVVELRSIMVWEG